MIELLQAWFENKDYRLGVELYRRYGSNLYLKTLFAKGADSYNIKKLEAELKALVSSPPAEDIIVSHKIIAAAPAQESKALPSESPKAPAEVKEAIQLRKSTYALIRVNRDALAEAYLTDNESNLPLSDMAHQILDGWDTIKECWDLTNFYDRYERLPEKVQIETDYSSWPSDVLNKTFLNNYKYIKKYKDNLKKRETVIERINASLAIKSTLEKRDAFFHPTLTIPSVDQLDSGSEETEIID
ncbi:hypothetical protein [Jiulongibacter sediminis]|uniref:hypothetical protein n=1 Tax=Jiulongibacter sediminis TaxID=1605367 RepID=UPI0026EAAA26|nr:hypothetical protein [Jiulongibacter sediminis]